MRGLEALTCVPALALVARKIPAECERVLQSGFQVWLSKPINPERLAAAVASMSGRAGPETAWR